jgi:hypothetical protein
MKVGYNRALAVAILALGMLSLLRAIMSDPSFGLVTGPLFILAGIAMLFRPQFRYDPATRTVTVVALVGPKSRRFGGLSVAGGRIVCTSADGSRKKVPVYRGLARRAEWDAVLAQLGR